MAESLTLLGLDARGVALAPDWTLDVPLLRTSIRKLRQACTHPQVGNVVGGAKTSGPKVRSIDQVLSSMLDSTARQLLESRRVLVRHVPFHFVFALLKVIY